MIKKIFLLLFLASAVTINYNVDAQVVGKYLEKKLKQATNRAGEKADQEVTEEMNEQVDKGVESIFDNIFNDTGEEGESTSGSSGPNNKNSSEALSAAMMKSMGISMDPANIEENYTYSGNILMTVQSWDSEGNTDGELDYKTYMSDNYSGFAMEFTKNDQHSTMVFDTKNGAMIILSESNGQKTGIVTSYAIDSLMESDYTEETVEDYSIYNQNLKKTGKTKTVAGYKCDEYRYEDEEIEGSVWMTDELPAELWARMFSANVIAASNIGAYGGFVMEMEQIDKENQYKTFMQVREVNENQPTTISTAGYQMMSFGMDVDAAEEEK